MNDNKDFTIIIKRAREYAYLGMYSEANKTYKDSIKKIENLLSYYKYNSQIHENFSKLYQEINKEQKMNEILLYAVTKAQLPKPKRTQKRLPFNQRPFAFHHQKSFESYHHQKPKTKRNKSQNRIQNPQHNPQPYQNNNNYGNNNRNNNYGNNNRNMNYDNYNQQNGMNQGYGYPPQQYDNNRNYNYDQQGYSNNNYQNNMGRRQQPKDPMVWDSPSPQKKRKKKKGKKEIKNLEKKRKYDKPWKQNPKPKNQLTEEQKSKFIYSVYPDGTGPDDNLINMIEKTVITNDPGIKFEDIAGLDDAKEALKMNVLCPLMMKDFFKKIRKPPKGILLYGPAGTGKTMLAKAIASTGKTTFFNVNPSTLASKWKGDSEKLVRLLFEMARFYAPTTIFIDEIDSLLSERSNKEHESSRKVKVQFFVEIDGINNIDIDKEEAPKLFILAATNRPWDLDEAILRRLSKRIYIPLPNKKSRKILFQLKMKDIELADDIDFEFLVQKTEKYNSDDIESVCREAALMPFKRKMSKMSFQDQQSTQFFKDLEQEIIDEKITMADFKQALKNVKKSSSIKFLSQYEEWTKNHASI